MKLIFLEQELNQGINRVKVAHIKPDHVKPPRNAWVHCDFPQLEVEDAYDNKVNKYEVDVDVVKNGNEIVAITLESESLIEVDKSVIEADEKYLAEIKRKRKEEYAKEIDGLNFELMELLANGIVNKKVKIDGTESETLAQKLLTKKQEIKDRIK